MSCARTNRPQDRTTLPTRHLNVCTMGRDTNLLETKKTATERCGSSCGVPMWGPHAGSPCGVTMWDPDLGSPCGIPMWGPQKLPICGITKINFLRTIFLRSRNAQRDCCCCCRYCFFFAVICKSPQIQAQCAAQIGANGRQKFHRPRSQPTMPILSSSFSIAQLPNYHHRPQGALFFPLADLANIWTTPAFLLSRPEWASWGPTGSEHFELPYLICKFPPFHFIPSQLERNSSFPCHKNGGMVHCPAWNAFPCLFPAWNVTLSPSPL